MTFIHLGEWLAQRELLTPEKVGLIDSETGARFTYRMLNRRARALATYLEHQYHIQQGERVAVLAFNAPEYLDAFFACALLGAILVPLNWRLTARELRIILNDCKPKLLLHDLSHTERAGEVASTLHNAVSPLSMFSFGDFPGESVAL